MFVVAEGRIIIRLREERSPGRVTFNSETSPRRYRRCSLCRLVATCSSMAIGNKRSWERLFVLELSYRVEI
jgi:hypothetical protein